MSFGGSGGEGSISTDSDVLLNNPANGQVLSYSDGKWTNQVIVGGSTGDVDNLYTLMYMEASN